MKSKKDIENYIQDGYDNADARCDESGVEAWDYISGVLEKSKTPMAALKVFKNDIQHPNITLDLWDALRSIIKFIEN